MYLQGLLATFLVCFGVSGNDPSGDPDQIKKNWGDKTTAKQQKMTIHFLRHSESTWNAYKQRNRMWGKLGSLYGQMSSKYQDAELTERGITEVKKLEAFIFNKECTKKAEPMESIRFENYGNCEEHTVLSTEATSDNTVIATSNLRRTIMTAIYGFATLIKRVVKGDKRIHMLSILQETENGVDAKTKTPKGKFPNFAEGSSSEKAVSPESPAIESKLFEMSGSVGDLNSLPKSILGTKPEDRFTLFCKWALMQPSGVEHIVVAGHSSWLQKFLKSRLRADPNASSSQTGLPTLLSTLMKHKLGNASLLTFDIKLDKDAGGCVVEDETVKLTFGGVDYKDKKKA